MNKETFLKELNHAIRKLPENERQEIEQDFVEHFEFGLAEGKQEEEIAKALGSPQQIGKELRMTYHLEQVESKKSVTNILRATWAAVGIGFFNLVIVLGPFIAFLAIILSGWIIGAAFILSPILVIINTLFFIDYYFWYESFVSIFLLGFGIFIIIGMYYLTKVIAKWFVKYLHFNIKFIKRGA